MILVAQPSLDTETNENDLEQIFAEAESINSLRSLIIQQNGEVISERYFKEEHQIVHLI